MKPTGKPRYTIGQLMIWIAVMAGLMALPRLLLSPDRPVVFYFFGALGAVLLLNSLIEIVVGIPCPACSRRALRRLARHRHYFRCMACRAQFKQFGFGPWLDASGPEDAARYHKRTEAGTWKDFDVPRDLKGSNSGALLGSKRSRDLLEEVKQHPPRPAPGRRFEETERKVREFLRRRQESEDEV